MHQKIQNETGSRTVKQTRGDAAEASAGRFLESRGLHILERGYLRRRGELDLVCADPASRGIVFVEVRYRSRLDYGGPLASVTYAKARKLRITARAWLQQHADPRRPARIDVIGICPARFGAPGDLSWEGQRLTWVQSAC